MIHPRLSISALSSFRWSFDEDLALWRKLGTSWAGVISNKLGDDLDAGFTRLDEAGIRVATAIGANFDLSTPASWEARRAELHAMIDAVAAHGGWSVYITHGRTTGAIWRDVFALFAEAVAPTVAHAREKGVRFAIETTERADVSFITNLRDGLYAAEQTGIGLVVDLNLCWMTRDLRELLLDAAPHIALVQISDTQIGKSMGPGALPMSRVPFGEGDLPIERLLRDVKDTGYAGPLDLELPGPLGETEGYEPVIRRGAEKASALMYELGF
jgi:sugar phosphate isomerase/epimerase